MKKVLINVEEKELRVAILEDDQLVELYIENLDEKSILNNIYKGRVEDVLPGLKAAFVNIGLEKNAFLHFDDVRPDLLWAKYRELNPDMADAVPTAREALAGADSAGETADADDEAQEGGSRRKRGKRGGKKRRPEAEDSYSPGLPVGVTEDDLEDEDDDVAASGGTADAEDAALRPVYAAADEGDDEFDGDDAGTGNADEATDLVASADAAGAQEGQQRGPLSEEEVEARKLARMEKQRQRRERWEQKKLERQQRRQAEREARQAQRAAEPTVQHAEEEELDAQPVAATAYGTRGAASIYDSYLNNLNNSSNNQRRNNKAAKYGDNFGNIAPRNQTRTDHRDSQVDFFGPYRTSQEDQHSEWDERQPDLGPVPGLGAAFVVPGLERKRSNRNRPNHQRQGQQSHRPNRSGSGGQGGNHKGDGQGGNQGNKKNNNNRRGGKKRTMRRRDNRSFFALSIDDLLPDDLPQVETDVTEEVKPKRTVRRKKTADDAEGAAAAETKPKTTRKTAAKKTTVAKADKPAAPKKTTARKKEKAADDAEAVVEQELPLNVEAGDNAPATAATEAKKKPAARTTRTRKTTAKSAAATTDVKPAETKASETKAAEPKATETPVKADKPEPAKEPVAEKSEPAVEKPIEPVTTVAEKAEADSSEKAGSAPVAAAAEKSEAKPVAESSEKSDGAPVGDVADSAETVSVEVASDAASADEGGQSESRSRRDRNRRDRNRRDRRDRRDRGAARAGASDDGNGQGDGQADSGSAKSDANGSAAGQSQQSSKQQSRGQQQQQRSRDRRQRIRRPLFQEVYKKGDEIMVQVVKEEIGQKGARISSYVSLPGRYLVLLPYPNQEGGVSRKVEDVKERKRLKSLLSDISTDETAFIIRTAGVFRPESEIRNDVEFLSQEWNTIASKYREVGQSALVYDDHDILYRLARDVFDESIGEIQIDSHVEAEKLKGILQKLIPSLADKVKLYSGAENIFHKSGVTRQIQKAARRKVWLKSGGYLIIDEAEALTAIDVNTGKSVGKDDQEKLILRTNLEAARTTARELKLRDLGGLIVIDFIDMKDSRNRDQVLNELRMQLRKDRSKTSVSAISEFGLVEMTRKRVRRSLRKTLFMDCPYCQGAGVVLNEQQIWLHLKHEVVRNLELQRPASALTITVNPRIRAYIDQNYKDVIRRLEQKYDTEIRIVMSDIFHIENYQIEKQATGVISGSATVTSR